MFEWADHVLDHGALLAGLLRQGITVRADVKKH